MPPDPAYLESRSHTPRGTQPRTRRRARRRDDIFDDMAGVLLFAARCRRALPAHRRAVFKKVAAQALTVLFKLVHDLFIDKKYMPEGCKSQSTGS